MTVTQLEAVLPARELLEWQDKYRRDPWGTMRDNLHAGLIASSIVNVHRSKSSRAAKASDFLLVDSETARATDRTRSLAFLRSLAKPKGQSKRGH